MSLHKNSIVHTLETTIYPSLEIFNLIVENVVQECSKSRAAFG
jgi:hypothetical protein